MSERPLPTRRNPCPATLMVWIGLTILVGLGCTQQSDDERVEAGREVFMNNCARCHQHDGEGFDPIYPSIVGNPIVTLHDPDPAIAIVLDGSGGMPGFRHDLDLDELAQVVSYIRAAWGNDASPVTPTQMR